jgi:hypothetical protein
MLRQHQELSLTTLSMMTFSIMTLRINGLFATFSITDTAYMTLSIKTLTFWNFRLSVTSYVLFF